MASFTAYPQVIASPAGSATRARRYGLADVEGVRIAMIHNGAPSPSAGRKRPGRTSSGVSAGAQADGAPGSGAPLLAAVPG